MSKPAVPIISGRFEGDAIASSRAFGMPALRFVIVPRIYRNLSPAESISNTEPAFDDLVGMLTADCDGAYDDSPTEQAYRFEGEDRFDAVQRMNDDFLRRDWGDGFPLLPPTRGAVDELIDGVSLPADHVVCALVVLDPQHAVLEVQRLDDDAVVVARQRPDRVKHHVDSVVHLSPPFSAVPALGAHPKCRLSICLTPGTHKL